MMRRLIAAAPLAALLLAALPAAAQDEPAAEADPAAGAPAQTYETLEPRLRRIFFERAGDFIRTPDGRIWDGWGQRAYREALEDNAVVISEGVYESSGVFRQRRETGKRLDVRDTAEAKAWKLEPRLKASATTIVPLWYSLEQRRREGRPFHYINQLGPADDLDPLRDRFTRVEAELGGGFMRVRVFGAGERQRGGTMRTVLAPEDLVIEDGQLPGEFILWPSGGIKPPGHIKLQRNEKVYRYIPLSEIRLTPEQLVEAVLAGKAEVAQWDFRRSGEEYIWSRSVVTPQFRQPRPERPAVQRPQGEERSKPAPPPDPTHILRLKDGRTLRGRLVSEAKDHIVFALHTGAAEFETRFAAGDVEGIEPIE